MDDNIIRDVFKPIRCTYCTAASVMNFAGYPLCVECATKILNS